jgi:hypothetical protein
VSALLMVTGSLVLLGAVAMFILAAVFDLRRDKLEGVEFARRERDARIADLEYEIYEKPSICRLTGHRWRPDHTHLFFACGRCGIVQETPRPSQVSPPERGQ